MLEERAREIIAHAVLRGRRTSYISNYYGIPPDAVHNALKGKSIGTLNCRCVLRVEIARARALIDGDYDFYPSEKDRYKGTRGI